MFMCKRSSFRVKWTNPEDGSFLQAKNQCDYTVQSNSQNLLHLRKWKTVLVKQTNCHRWQKWTDRKGQWVNREWETQSFLYPLLCDSYLLFWYNHFICLYSPHVSPYAVSLLLWEIFLVPCRWLVLIKISMVTGHFASTLQHTLNGLSVASSTCLINSLLMISLIGLGFTENIYFEIRLAPAPSSGLA